MSEAIGLSFGTTNLVAVRAGRAPVVRPTGGSDLYGADATATALAAMARTVGDGTIPVVVAVPAYWGPGVVGELRSALRSQPTLSPAGVPPTIVSEAAATLAALRARPGFPDRGVVALCDFGASGSSITLADAGAGLTPIGETLRFGDFSGDLIDQALLHHILTGARSAGRLDPAATTAVGAFSGLQAECRAAKERLSTETSTTVAVDLPGYRSDIRVTREELNAVMSERFNGFLNALGDVLEHNRIPAVSLSAVAAVGGGAAIPAITQRLSADLRVPVITTPMPWSAAAEGATMLAGPTYTATQTLAPDAPTGLAPATPDQPTSLSPSAWASSASDGTPSSTHRALAWSEDDAIKEPVPYTGEEYAQAPTSARPPLEFEPAHTNTGAVPVEAPLPWYRRPPLLFGIAATVAAVAVGGLALTLSGNNSSPTTTTTRVTKPGEPAASTSVAPQTITVTGGNGQTTVTTITPPPTSSSSSSAETTATTTTTTTTTPTTTTTTPTTTTTTTTPTTTTTQPPTTTTTRTTTTNPPTTTTQPPTTTTVAPVTPTTTVAPVTPTTTVAPTTQAIVTPTLKPAPAE